MPTSSPSGLKVLLMTDLVGSVSLQQRLGLEAYTVLKDQHDALVEAVVENAPTGQILEHTGDGYFVVFDNVKDAVETALLLQYRIHHGKWAQERPKVRIGIHLGEVTPRIDHATGVPRYAGINVSLTARIMDRASGDQILLSRPVYENARSAIRAFPVKPPTPPPTLSWQDHGRYVLKGLEEEMELFEVGGEGLAPFTKPPGGTSESRAKSLAPPRWIIGLVTLAVLATGAFFLHREFSAARVEQPSTAPAAPLPDRTTPTVAVLPFSNFDGAENSSFAAGMHDDIITRLAQLEQLQVISRTSVAAYSETRKNLRAIGSELGASHLVEGSVRRANNRVRISVQLIEASSDRHLWAENYDRELEDVFAIQSEISKKIATQLLERLSPAEAAELEKSPTTNIAAYDAFNRARELWRNREGDEIPLPEIATQLKEALRLDPDFDAASALLTELYTDWAGENGEGSTGEAARFAIGQIKRFAPAIKRAIEEGIVEADGDAAAERLAEATRSARQGDFETATRALVEAAALDPENRPHQLKVAARLSALGQYGQAVAVLEKWQERHPDDEGATLALLLAHTEADPSPAHRGQLRAWVEDRSKAAQVIAPSQIYPLAALLGEPALGFDLFDRLSLRASTPTPPINRGLMFFGVWSGYADQAQAAARRELEAAGENAETFDRLSEVVAKRLLDKPIDLAAIAATAEAALAASTDPFHRLESFPFLVALWSRADPERAAELFLDEPPPAAGSDYLPALVLRAPFMPGVFEHAQVKARLAERPAWESLANTLLARYSELP